MGFCLITFRSVTYAQRGEAVLKRASIKCTLRRTPAGLSERGCSYCLQIRIGEVPRAVKLLEAAEVSYSAVYRLDPEGKAEVMEI